MNGVLTHIIGIGQPAAGDDYAGIAVARALREQRLPAGTAVHEITDPGRLVELLDGIRHAILIDAVVSNENPGNIMRLTPEELAACPSSPLSSHGTGVADAIALLRVLSPATACRDIRIIGISIKAPTEFTRVMTAPVAAAVPRATNLVLKLFEDNKTASCA